MVSQRGNNAALRNIPFKVSVAIETRNRKQRNALFWPRKAAEARFSLRMTEISLDSQKDVQFLKSNISLATREKLDTHLPPSAVPNIHSDTLRKRVEEMLDEVTRPL